MMSDETKSAQQWETLYTDWVHRYIGFHRNFPNFPPPKLNIPRITSTQNALVAACLPDISIPNTNQSNSSVHFWLNILDDSMDNHTELKNAIAMQYKKAFPRINTNVRLNPALNWLGNFLEKGKSRPPNQRLLVHYYSHGCSPAKDFEEFEKVLSTPDSLQCTTFILESNKCGQICSKFEELAQDLDTFVFCSCNKDEFMPISSDLPVDLFSSCLTSPAKMALFWHSRHYYCFKTGPLKPLSMSFVEECEQSLDGIFSDIQLLLKHTVEAIAFETLDRALFLRLFRTDPVVAQLSVNFVYACRILSFFGVHPVSYPSIPSLAKHKLWQHFDQRMDVELFRLHQSQPSRSDSFESYLDNVIKSLSTVISVSSLSIEFYPQVSFISSMLASQNTELVTKACDVLAKFLDGNPGRIRSVLHFPIAQQLARLVKSQFVTTSLLFCLMKILCYRPEIGDLMEDFLLSKIARLLRSKDTKVVMIIVVLFLKSHPNSVMPFLQNMKGLALVMPLLRHTDPAVRVWTLFAVSMFVEVIKDENCRGRIFAELRNMIETPHGDEKAALFYCMSRFIIDFTTEQQEHFLQYILSQPDPQFHVVRCHVVASLGFFYQSRESSFLNPSSEIEILCLDRLTSYVHDPHPIVYEMACEIAESLTKHDKVVVVDTKLIDGFAAELLTPIYENLMAPLMQAMVEPSRKEFTLQPKTSQKKPIPAMKLLNHYAHPETITSNIISVPRKRLIFGDSRGGISTREWSDTQVTTVQTFDCPIHCLRHFPNNNYPLLFVSNGRGHLLSFSLSEDTMPFVSGFRFPGISVNSVDHRVAFDVDAMARRIVAYEAAKSDTVMLFDMESERLLRSINFAGKTVNHAGCIPGTPTFGVCTNTGFEMYDLRINECALSVNLSSPPLDFRAVDPSIPSFMLCSMDGLVASFDFRDATPNLRSSLRINNGKSIEALSFDMYSSTTLAAVGHTRGLIVVDLEGRKETSLSIRRSASQVAKASSILFQNNSNSTLLAVNHDNNFISVITEVIERD